MCRVVLDQGEDLEPQEPHHLHLKVSVHCQHKDDDGKNIFIITYYHNNTYTHIL